MIGDKIECQSTFYRKLNHISRHNTVITLCFHLHLHIFEVYIAQQYLEIFISKLIRVIDLEYKSNIIIQCVANLMRRVKTFLEHCEYSHGSN